MRAVKSDRFPHNASGVDGPVGLATPSPISAAQIANLADCARSAGLQISNVEDAEIGVAANVHSSEYLEFLQLQSDQADMAFANEPQFHGGQQTIISHPVYRQRSYALGSAGRIGWHRPDAYAPIDRDTWAAASEAARVAIAAAADTMRDGAAYGLCRPAGRHAASDTASGYCYLNNAAIAAHWYLSNQFERVAILSFGLHHANGTQSIFYRRRDVLTVSVHTDPNHAYPFYAGHAGERGYGDGEGSNLNLPLPLGAADDAWLAAVTAAKTRLTAFSPDALIVCVGLDIYRSPIEGAMAISADGLISAGESLGAIGATTLLLQESVGPSPEAPRGLISFLAGFRSGAKI